MRPSTASNYSCAMELSKLGGASSPLSQEPLSTLGAESSELSHFASKQPVPKAPVLGPAPDPQSGPPEVDLPESALEVLAAFNIFASWPNDMVRAFECVHEELWMRVRRGSADAAELREHLRKIPEPLVAMYSLKVQLCRRGRPPVNAEVLCEQIDLMLAERAAFWATQL